MKIKHKTIKIVGLVISTIGVSAIMNNLLFGVVAHKANYPVEYIGLSFFVSLGVLLSFLLLSYIFDFSSIKEDGRGFAFFDGETAAPQKPIQTYPKSDIIKKNLGENHENINISRRSC